MFGKLKEKLKSALNIFSKKAEEQAEVRAGEPAEAQARAEVSPAKETAEEKRVLEEKGFAEKEEAVEEKRIVEETKVIEEEEIIEKEGVIEEKEIFEKKRIIKEEEIVEREGQIAEKKEIKTKKTSWKPGAAEPELAGEVKEKIKEKVKEEAGEKAKEKIKGGIKEKIKEEKEPEPVKKSFFSKLREAITTKTISAEKFDSLFWELEVALLENNVSVEVIEKIKEDLKEELVDRPLPRNVPEKIEETLRKTLQEILSFEKIDLLRKSREKKPLIIAFFGINGSGKTTSIAKLAKYFQKQGKSVVLAACDTFRAAAIDQLQEHADRLKVKMIRHNYGSDAAAVAFDAVKYADKNDIDIVMIDTAGRLHSNVNLMQELEKIIRVTRPDLKLFVGESITGNDCIEQARKFNEQVDLDGSILTKADVDEKGGAPLSIAYTIKKPILFLGTGQRYEDLEEFEAEKVLGRLGF